MLLSLATQLGAEQADDTVLIAAEVIVKFAQQEPVSAEITKVVIGEPTASQAGSAIRTYVSSLSDEIGMPLVYSRATSGRELVLALRRDVVLEELARRIRSAKDVKGVEVSLDDAGSPMYRTDELIVEFHRCSDSLRTVSEALSGESAADEPATELGAGLVDDSRYQITARLLADKRLAIGMDWKRTTFALVKELSERPEVQYAQPSFVMRAY